jgi:oligoendopeptidase F
MSAPDTATDPELHEVAWDLTDLFDGVADGADPRAAVDELLDEAKRRADAFAAAYAGKLAEMDGPGLVAAMHALEEIEDLAARAGSYAHLSFSVDTADPATGALL